MARLNTRPSPPPEADDEDVRQLNQARTQNDLKLKTRFERIFRKYEHNFEGVGDEIDIRSGEIVVDNGHLQNMRDEADPGRSASSRFVRTFQEKLEHEDEDEGEDEREEEEEEEDDDDDSEGRNAAGSGSDGEDDASFAPFRALSRPPPRLAQLLVGGSGPTDVSDDQTSQDASLVEEESSTAAPPGLLEQVPALQDSMSALTGRSRRPAVDAVTIQALGTSIANQLAQLMAGSSKKSKRKSQPKPRRETIDPVWGYPDITVDNQQKRKRSPSPAVPPPISSPRNASPGQRSLWAPEGSRSRKRFKPDATPSLRKLRSSIIPSSAVRGTDLKRCMNCSITNSLAWQAGPGGGDLCVSCGKYYERNGRMKPFDSPTPSVEDRDPSAEPMPEIELGEPLVPTTPAVEEDVMMESAPALAVHAEHVPTPPPEAAPHSMSAPAENMHEPLSEPADTVPDTVPGPIPEAAEVVPPREPSPSRELSQNIAITEDASRMSPEAIVTRPSIVGPSIEPKLEDAAHPEVVTDRLEPGSTYLTETLNPMFITDTPVTYPANTSRPMVVSPVKHRGYSVEEDALIIRLREQEKLPWHVLARMFPRRTQFSVQNRYTRQLHNTNSPGRDHYNAQRSDQQVVQPAPERPSTPNHELDWSQEQDGVLLELRQDKELEWEDIASVLPGHSAEAVQKRYIKLLRDEEVKREEHLSAKHGNWSPREDALIVRLKEVDKLAWHQIAERFADRSLQSVQKRYSRWLTPERRTRAANDPTIGIAEDVILQADPGLAMALTPSRRKDAPFGRLEDDTIARMVETEGLDWEQVAAQLPGRTVRSVYLRYTEHLKIKSEALPAPQPGFTLATGASWRTSSPGPVRRTDTPPLFGAFGAGNLTATERNPIFIEVSGPGSRTSFTQLEDDTLVQLKGVHNASWEEVALRLPGRSVKAISQRFAELMNRRPTNLTINDTACAPCASDQPLERTERSTSAAPKPGLRQYTQEEDDLIIRLRAEDMSWEDMVVHLDGRTPSSLENHWHTKLLPKTRKSLPAPASARAGLLKKALNNSRRRSDPRQPVFGARHGDGEGGADDPIMVQDGVDANLPSEQLSGELRFSVRPPSYAPQLAPQPFEQDRVAFSAGRFQRLMLAAENFAMRQNNPHIVQRVEQIYQSNADDLRLQKLLELTNSDSPVTPTEVDWAFEAFDHEHGRTKQTDHGVHGASQPWSDRNHTSTGGRGKGKGRQRDLPLQEKQSFASLESSRPSFESRLNQPAARMASPASFDQHGYQTPAQTSQKGAVGSLTPNYQAPQPMQIASGAPAVLHRQPSNSSDSGRKIITAVLAAGQASTSTATAAAAAVPPEPVVPAEPSREASPEELQLPPDPVSEELLAAPSRPKHSFSELIHMALDATQSSAMHPKTMCSWIEKNFEYYRIASPSWKSEILFELKANAEFEQCGTGRARPWRTSTAAAAAIETPAAQPVVDKKRAEGSRKSAEEAAAVPTATLDPRTIPCSDDADGADDDASDTIIVKPAPKKWVDPAGKRTTDSAQDIEEYTPVKAPRRPRVGKRVATRDRLRSSTKPIKAEEAAPATVQREPQLDLTVEIADSDGADELSSSPVQKLPPPPTSSEKRVRFMDTVEVRGPTRAFAAESTPSLNKPKRAKADHVTKSPVASSSSNLKPSADASSAKTAVVKPKPAVASSSPVFMKPAVPNPKVFGTPTVGAKPFPKNKSRLSQLRRESIPVDTPPRTPKTAWPRRHSTPTAIFSHRGSPALGKGVMFDRFGLGRKRVVETPVRELADRQDQDEDELAY